MPQKAYDTWVLDSHRKPKVVLVSVQLKKKIDIMCNDISTQMQQSYMYLAVQLELKPDG